MATKKADKVELKAINRRLITVRLIGTSPLIQHQWAEKAKEMMRAKHAGKKTKTRDVRDPEQEVKDATYWTEDGKPGLLVVAVKAAVIESAHQDLGIPKTLVRKALFVYPPGRMSVVPFEGISKKLPLICETRVLKVEDMVRVGAGSADLRYRPYFYQWAALTQWEIDVELLQLNDFLTLLDRAGFGVGVHEWRPEKGGEFGRFRVDPDFKIIDMPMD